MLTQTFGISSLVLSIVAIFIPVYGAFISGLSGIFAWASIGRAAIFGLAAVIVNLCNIIFLSPIFLSLIAIDSVEQLLNQDQIFKYWIIVLIIQLIAIFVFLFNTVLLTIISRKRANNALSEKHANTQADNNRHPYDTDITSKDFVIDNNQISPSPLTKVLIKKTYGNRKGEKSFWINRSDHISQGNKSTHKDGKIHNPVFIVGMVLLLCALSTIGVYHLFLKKEPYVPLNRVYETPQISKAQKPPSTDSKKPSQEGSYYPDSQPRSSGSNQRRPIERIYSYLDSEGKRQYTNAMPPDNSTDVTLHPELTSIEMITPVEITGSEIYVPVTIIHRGNQFNTSLLLDPSSPHSILPGRNADFLKADYLQNRKYQISKDDQIVQEVRKLEIFKVGPHENHDFLIVTQSGKGAIQRGILGADFLTKFPHNIDQENKVIVWF